MIANEDCDLLLFWTLAIEYMINTGMTNSFKRKHPNATEWLEYMMTILDDIKDVIQKYINK